jgi:hypothetical protein
MGTRKHILSQGFYDRVLLAIITGVDQTGGTVSIMFLDQFGVRDKVPIPVLGMSQDAWIRYMPQVNDVVYTALRPDDSVVILGWLPYNYGKRVDAFKNKEKNAAGGGNDEMMQELKPGEIDARSKGGSYLRLNAIGDVLIMSLAGRVQMFGKESFTEASQLGFKLTDGKSWIRFGAPFRLFPAISDRELPTGGSGQPLNKPSDLRERDTRLYDKDGNLLVQESLGTVIDDQGGLELSGTTGSGASHDVNKLIKGDIGAAKDFATTLADPAALAGKLSGISDHIKELATQFVTQISSAVDTIITGASTVYSSLGKTAQFTSIAQTAADVKGIVTGAGAIADGLDQLRGIGDVGKKLRYRLLINKGGKQVAAFDIDEDGGVVIASESTVGTTINANKGGLVFYAKKGMRLVAKGLAATFDTIGFTSSKDTRLVSGRKQIRTAGTDIVDTAQNITQVASQEVAIGGGTSVKVVVGTTSITLSPGSVDIEGGGTINVNGGGTVNIAGSGLVAITGGLVTIN